MFGNSKPPPKPVIRKVTVQKPAAPKPKPKPPAQTGINARPRPENKNGSGSVQGGGRKSNGSANGAASSSSSNGLLRPNGYYSSSRSDSKSQSPAPRRGAYKRKAPSPSATPYFSSSSDDEDSGSDGADGARKRARPSPRNGTLEPDLSRKIFGGGEEEVDEGKWPIIQGYDFTVGKEKAYKRVFAGEGEIEEVELQYPSRWGKERFQLVVPYETAGYNPIEDIIQTIDHVCNNYFPPDQASSLTDDASGFARRLKRALQSRSFENFAATVTEYNELISKSLADNTIQTFTQSIHSLPLSLVERILSQIYNRTVSPQVNILKQYENGTDNVYGELLPRFTNQIFSDTGLKSGQVFVDLGSGVGNVVLQAALQIGCESWGIEFMPNPCLLATAQQREFQARCRRYNIAPGSIHLLQGDFLQSPEIEKILQRADVVLVNNQAFTPDLNDKLVMKFLDLKDGCKVVSLKSFVPANWRIKERNLGDVRNLLYPVTMKEYFSDSVSWTDREGTWFLAEKDSGKIVRYAESRKR